MCVRQQEPCHAPCVSPHRVVGVPGLDAQLRQDPDAVGEFEGLVEHVLPLHVPLGYGVHIVVLQLAGDSVLGGERGREGRKSTSVSSDPSSAETGEP